MKLHVVVGSPSSRKVQAVVNHLGQAAQVRYYDIFAGEMRSPEYLALNANGMVPVLEDGPFVLWESNAISQYLADKAGSDSLFPRNPQKRADVVRWQCWELTHFNKAFGNIVWETIVKPAFGRGDLNEGLLVSAMDNLARFAAVLDRHMAGRACVAGDAITIADYSLIHLENYRDRIAFDWSPYPNLNSYFDRMHKVEHWARTAPASAADIGRRPKAA